MTDKKNEGSMPKVSKNLEDLPPKASADSKVKGGMSSIDGTMGGGTTTTGDNTIPM